MVFSTDENTNFFDIVAGWSVPRRCISWSVVLFYGVSTDFGSFTAELNFKNSVYYKYSFYLQTLEGQTVLFQAIQFSKSSNSSI